jgi:phosphoesterase RecJ-like protein
VRAAHDGRQPGGIGGPGRAYNCAFAIATPMNVSLFELFEQLASRKEVLVCSHLRPDPDGIGSALALAELLRSRGVKTHLRCDTPIAHSFTFIDGLGEFRELDEKKDAAMLRRIDALVVCDVGKTERLPKVWAAIRAREQAGQKIFKAALDHHHEPDQVFDALHCNPNASSSSELVFNLYNGLKANPSANAARAIYAGIHFDTGGFVYERTTPSTHHAAAILLKLGADPYDILRRLYWQRTRSEFECAAECARNMEFHAEGRITLITLDRAMQKRYKIRLEDLSGVVDLGLTVAGVDFALLMYEISAKEVKISFRSKGLVPVLPLAKIYGGGGHNFACGATINEPLAKARARLLRDAKKML